MRFRPSQGNQWHFGMKAHRSGVGTRRRATSAQKYMDARQSSRAAVHDRPSTRQAHKLLHGGETVTCGAERRVSGGSQEGLRHPRGWRWNGWGRLRQTGGEGEGVGRELTGGASLPEAEAGVRVCQGALPGSGEERGGGWRLLFGLGNNLLTAEGQLRA